MAGGCMTDQTLALRYRIVWRIVVECARLLAPVYRSVYRFVVHFMVSIAPYRVKSSPR